MSAPVSSAVALANERAERAPSALIDGPPTPWPEAPDVPKVPDPDSLPLEGFPPSIRKMIGSVAGATQTPTDLAAMLALGVLSTALGGRATIEVDGARGWTEASVLYLVVILPPAARKSPVYAAFTEPLLEYEAERREQDGPAYHRALDSAEVAADRLKAAKAAAVKGTGTLQDVAAAREALEAVEAAAPRLLRLLAQDATPEALPRLMDSQGGRIALLSPEGDPLRISDGRYSDGAARLGELKQAWGAESITVDRIGRDSIRIARPALTLALTMQPSVLGSLKNSQSMRGEGLFARVLWCAPRHGIGSRLTGLDVPRRDEAVSSRYRRTVRRLLEAADASGDGPHTVTMSPEALGVVHSYEAEVEPQLADGERLGDIADWAGKIVGQAARVALLLEVARRAEDERPLFEAPISRQAMADAVAITRALTTHALAVLGEGRAGGRLELLAHVLRRANELPDGSTVRDLFERVKGREALADIASLQDVVGGLAERGCLRLVRAPAGGPGRPPSPTIEIHPAIRAKPSHNSHNTPAVGKSGNSANCAKVAGGSDIGSALSGGGDVAPELALDSTAPAAAEPWSAVI